MEGVGDGLQTGFAACSLVARAQEPVAEADRQEARMTVCYPAQSFAGRAGVVARLGEADSEVDKWPARAAVASVRDKGPVWLAPQLEDGRTVDSACMHNSVGALGPGRAAARGWRMFGACDQDVDLLLKMAETCPVALAMALSGTAAFVHCALAETVQARWASRVVHVGSRDGSAWPSWDALAAVFLSVRHLLLHPLHPLHRFLLRPCPRSRPVLCVHARRHTTASLASLLSTKHFVWRTY